MGQPEIILIAAVSQNKVIGVDGKLPWQIKEDMARFKQLTTPHPIVMGRVTYESLPQKYRPLPGRQNVILTRDSSFGEKGIFVVRSLEEALENLKQRKLYVEGIDYSKIFIGGGQQVYERALPYATSLEITHVHQQVNGENLRYFPEIFSEWNEQKREDKEGYSFVTYGRI